MTPLSDLTVDKIANALKNDATKFIQESEDYSQMMFKVLDEFLDEKMGSMDSGLKGTLVCFLMDKIYMVSDNVH